MQPTIGQIIEISFDSNGEYVAWIACPAEAIPAPGQYVLAWAPAEAGAPLATPVFASHTGSDGFRCAPPLPSSWQPGTELRLHGPLGRGFHPPGGGKIRPGKSLEQRLVIAALHDTLSRLLPLLSQGLAQEAAITLFTDCPLPALPAAVEVSPVVDLPGALSWADFLVLDLALHQLQDLRRFLGLSSREALPCPAEALIMSPMPCAGLGSCSVCAVPARRSGWKLACKDGPVFDLQELEW